MPLTKKFFSPLPTSDSLDPKDTNLNNEKSEATGSSRNEDNNEAEDGSDNKSFKTSLRDALQEWSNDDARDIAEDDSTPLRSGL